MFGMKFNWNITLACYCVGTLHLSSNIWVIAELFQIFSESCVREISILGQMLFSTARFYMKTHGNINTFVSWWLSYFSFHPRKTSEVNENVNQCRRILFLRLGWSIWSIREWSMSFNLHVFAIWWYPVATAKSFLKCYLIKCRGQFSLDVNNSSVCNRSMRSMDGGFIGMCTY